MFFAPAALVGIEVTATALKGVRLAARGRRNIVTGRATVDLPAGLVTETFTRPNVTDRELFREHLGRLCSALDIREQRIGLALPDAAARVHVLMFETLPRREREFRDIIAWRLKRDNLLPFGPEEARIVCQVMKQAADSSGVPVLVSLIRQDVFDQYVSLLEESSLEPVIADLASFRGANFYHDEARRSVAAGETQVLVQASGRRLSLMVFERDALDFFRSKEINAANEGEGEAGGAMARTLRVSLDYYYEHRKGEKPVSVFLVAGSGKGMEWCEWLRHEGAVRVVPLEPERCVERGEGVAPDPAGEYAAATGAATG